MRSPKLSRLAPVLLLVLMSCATSPDGVSTVNPLEVGGVTAQASGFYHVITAADRSAHPASPLISPFTVVHHFASIAPIPAGDASSNPNGGSSGTGGTGASGTTGTGTPTPTPTPTQGSGGTGGTGGTASGTSGVSTYAGSTAGFKDAAAASAQFSGPVGLAVDASGNVFVADTQNNVIRKIDTQGNVTTFAGTAGQSGKTNAQGTSASFNQPTGLAFDSAGNLYVADSGNNLIRKIDKSGNVTTFAGSGSPGSAGGALLSATFNQPWGIATYQNTIYVSDFGGNLIRQIASGTVSTLAGNGTGGLQDSQSSGADAEFDGPKGLAVGTGAIGTGATGTVLVLVADSKTGSLRAVTQSGVTVTVLGTASANALGNCGGVAAVGHMCYVTNSQNGKIEQFDLNQPGFLSNGNHDLAGNGTTGTQNGTLGSAEFDDPEGLAAGVASGTLFVVDKGSSLVRKILF